MKIVIQIEMSNAIFENSNSGNELARILRSLANRVDGNDMEDESGCNLLDINGNKVGEFSVYD